MQVCGGHRRECRGDSTMQAPTYQPPHGGGAKGMFGPVVQVVAGDVDGDPGLGHDVVARSVHVLREQAHQHNSSTVDQ